MTALHCLSGFSINNLVVACDACRRRADGPLVGWKFFNITRSTSLSLGIPLLIDAKSVPLDLAKSPELG